MAKRLSSDLWVSAYLRQCRLNGSFAYLAKRGATAAGAIFIKNVPLGGSVKLYGPAPQSEFPDHDDEDRSSAQDSRIFELILTGADEEIETRLSKEKKFDPDIWIVEVEGPSEINNLLVVE